MRPEELLELIRRQPFVPLRIHTTEGRAYTIQHPDQIIVLKGRVDIGVGADGHNGVADRIEHLALVHVVRVEEVSSEQKG